MTNNSTSNYIQDIDYSNYEFINEIWLVRPASTIIVESAIFLPVVIFGIFGNVLSIYVLAKNYHICSPTNMLILNMAVADLFTLLVHPWAFLAYDLFQNYQFGVFGCKMESASQCTGLLAGVISVSTISYDRLTAIVLPQDAKLTRKNTKIVIIVIWIAACLISSPLFIYRKYKERQWKDFLEIFCMEDTFVTNIYWHVIITALVWLPLTIQLICYVFIAVKLHRYEKVVIRKLDLQVNYGKKAIRMMFTIIITFLLCHIPLTGFIFYRRKTQNSISHTTNVQNMASGTYHTCWLLSDFFILLKTAINPVIYSITNDKFQRSFKTTKLAKLFCPVVDHKSKVPSPPENLRFADSSTNFKRSLFFIFKKKHKPSTAITSIDTETSIGKYGRSKI